MNLHATFLFPIFSVQEIVFVMRVILDVNVTNVHLDIEDTRTVNHARAVELVVLILTHVKAIALARYENSQITVMFPVYFAINPQSEEKRKR